MFLCFNDKVDYLLYTDMIKKIIQAYYTLFDRILGNGMFIVLLIALIILVIGISFHGNVPTSSLKTSLLDIHSSSQTLSDLKIPAATLENSNNIMVIG